MSDTPNTGPTPVLNPQPTTPSVPEVNPQGTAPAEMDPKDNASNPAENLAEFWNDPEQTQGDSQQTPAQQQQGQGDQNQDASNPLDGIISNLQFTDAMNEQVMTDLQEGNVESFNNSLRASQQEGVRQTLQLTGQLMANLQESVNARIQEAVSAALTTHTNNQSLDAALPMANELAKPMRDMVYQQAMVRSKGNHAAAVALTKQMMEHMGTFNAVGNTSDPNQQEGVRGQEDWSDLGLIQ